MRTRNGESNPGRAGDAQYERSHDVGSDVALEPYPMKWFRLYSELRHDPKVQLLDPTSFKCWINLLTLANDGQPRGRIKPALIPYELRMDAKRAEKMVAYFIEQGLLERDGEFLVPHGWDKRQFKGDNSSERAGRYRDRLAEVGGSTYITHREAVLERDNHQCVYCGSDEKIVLDHLIPVLRGGDNDPDNLVAACKSCNAGKAGRLLEETSYTFMDPERQAQYEFLRAQFVTTGNGDKLKRVTVTKHRDAKRSSRSQKQSTETEAETDTPPPPPMGGMWGSEDQAFDAFWADVVRKEPSRARAREAWDKARQHASAEAISAGLARWLPVWEQFEDATKIPHITTWLNQQRWTVEQPLAPGAEPPRRATEPPPAPPPLTAEQQEARRARDLEQAQADEARQREREQQAIEQAARDPTRPPTVTPATWASLLPEIRRSLAMQP